MSRSTVRPRRSFATVYDLLIMEHSLRSLFPLLSYNDITQVKVVPSRMDVNVQVACISRIFLVCVRSS